MPRLERASLADAIRYFEEDADEKLVAKTRELCVLDIAVWIYDPEVEGAFGLVYKDSPANAMVIVYAPKEGFIGREDWDFEVADALYE